ncbi:NADP-dependent malic enzyme isoform X2 [Anguilla rostrata]|uniref:NADP-dependent malic enzyme isoform X2 n=1 Tax=Anguilla rostrata TaxID=7938 RepID=UPI0030D22194
MAHGLVKQESVDWEMHKSEDKSKTFVYTKKRGYDVTRNPHLNKGMAFSLEERLQLGIHGLLPPCFLSQDVQLMRVLRNYEMKKDDLDRYVLLMGLQDRNEKLFYRVLTSDIERFMPIVYTPTVGLACQQYGLTFRRPRGLFITIHDRSHISTLLQSWPEKDVRELLKDPLYIGLRHKRLRGQAYDDLLDEFMKAVTDRYGMDCLIQFEDFANTNAFRLLNKYRNIYCTFNDDIQGTAAVAVAGLLAALRITKSKMVDHTIVFQGAGEAAMGIADLITMAMEKEGITREQALRKIWMVDSKGLIVKGRDHLTHEKERFAHDHPQVNKLEDVVRKLQPTAIIGVAAVTGAFTEQIIKDMASFNERPIIFALSNPTSKAECTAEQCYTLTEGRGIFASGSPFDPVTLPDGRRFCPGQGNNAYVFPGVGLGVTACAIRRITDEIFLTSAETIASMVTDKDLAEGRLYPPLSSIQEVSLRLAVKIVEYAYEHNIAALTPEPKDKVAFIRSRMYSTNYDEFAVDSYNWPEDAMGVQSCKL